MENNKVQFTTSQMLKWMEYVADLKEVSPEKIKMLNTCGKRRNILATIATHKMILILQMKHTAICYINVGKQDMVIMKCTMVQAMNHQK